ncbi:MAG: phosphatase PAP2 family protein [Thermoleophilia bacterium]|nr:phosphatase PAP2 family protein [Thermoleophilia bacterium]
MRGPHITTRTDGAPAAARPGPSAALRRAHPLPVELAVLVAVMLAWQLVRLPFEVDAGRAMATTRALVDLERDLGMFREDRFATLVQSRPPLRDAATWWYEHMETGPVLGLLTALWFLDPARYPTVRTAFALTHVPAVAVLAVAPAAPPRWLPEFPYAVAPPAGWEGGWRNSTAAAVSLHVGIPVLLALAAVWMRPAAPLAWAAWAFPALVRAIVVGLGHHLLVDVVIGGACATAGWRAARLLHGPVPRGTARRGPAVIAAAAAGVCVAAAAGTGVLFAGLS